MGLADLRDEIRQLRRELEELRNADKPVHPLARHIRLAKKDSELTPGVHNIKFLNGDKSERNTVAWEVAADLDEDEVAVFELDGLWFVVSGGVAGSEESSECTCAALEQIKRLTVRVETLESA